MFQGQLLLAIKNAHENWIKWTLLSSYEGGCSHGYTSRYQGKYLRAFLALGPSRVTVEATPSIKIEQLARLEFQ